MLGWIYQVNALSLITLSMDPSQSPKSSNEQKGNKQKFLYKIVQYSEI